MLYTVAKDGVPSFPIALDFFFVGGGGGGV